MSLLLLALLLVRGAMPPDCDSGFLSFLQAIGRANNLSLPVLPIVRLSQSYRGTVPQVVMTFQAANVAWHYDVRRYGSSAPINSTVTNRVINFASFPKPWCVTNFTYQCSGRLVYGVSTPSSSGGPPDCAGQKDPGPPSFDAGRLYGEPDPTVATCDAFAISGLCFSNAASQPRETTSP